jgi:thiamine kinase-like enzyme
MGGLSNFVFRLAAANKSVIYRIYSDVFKLFQNRDVETRIHIELSKLGLAPKILYSDSTKRIEEFFTYKAVSAHQLRIDSTKVASLLGNIHRLAQNESIAAIFDSPDLRTPCIRRHVCNE